MHVIFHLVVKARVLFFMLLRVTYLSVAHNLLFSFISFPFIHAVSYSSPLTGKRYNVDYRANWNFQPPPVMPTFKPITLTIPHPASVISMFKPFNFNANWDYNFGNNHHVPVTSYGTPPPPPESTTKLPHNTQHLHTFNKQFNWDLNWNFNHASNLGAATASHEKEEAPVSTTTTTTTTTTTAKPVSDSVNSNGFHGEKRINIEWSLNVNHGSTSLTNSGNNAPSIKLQPPTKPSSNFKADADDDFDDGDDESKNDANNESSR
jgi:hypothetical protein